jgi:small subunit ribosomal protein S3
MGQKVNPKILRTGPKLIYAWNSKWFNEKEYKKYLKQDIEIREFLKKELKEAGIAEIEIERSATTLTITIHSARPGLIIGRGGTGAEELKNKLKEKISDKKININLNIVEVSKPNLSAELVLQGIIADIEKRVPYRRTMKQAIDKVLKAGAKGIKVSVSGRLDGVEIARSETLSQGRIPLHTLRADIDYASGMARTIYGAIGIKVWIYKGEVFK